MEALDSQWNTSRPAGAAGRYQASLRSPGTYIGERVAEDLTPSSSLLLRIFVDPRREKETFSFLPLSLHCPSDLFSEALNAGHLNQRLSIVGRDRLLGLF